jgi:chromosome segregation protein
MKLTRLELSGFKSFADGSSLAFEDGVTAIVGPNGCGKSNISDAVRWVLGEQRARLLRGSRMDDIIFQGSIKRRPINIAEVGLVFDNDDGSLDVPYGEVVVSRRLSRSGQSDYLLNGDQIRLRDLQDLLRGTGLGSDAGVVIEAQMIDRLLSDRAEERRSLFEEAAGIGLYRDRKDSTERRLERTAEDLQRLDDVISEVQTQVRSLARQRGKAERQAKFVAERFAIVMAPRANECRTDLPARREQLQTLTGQREERVHERGAAESRRTDLERRLAQMRIDLGALESDMHLAGERLDDARARRERATAERVDTSGRQERAEQEREAALAERQAAEEARQAVQMELDLRSASEHETRERLDQQRASVRELESGLQQLAERGRALQGERATLERDLEDLGSQEHDAAAQLSEASRELESAREDHTRLAAAVEQQSQEAHRADEALEEIRHRLHDVREREADVRNHVRRLDERLTQAQARKEALDALERNREGLAPAARALLEQRDRFDGAVLGPMSDFIHPSTEQATEIERRLGEWLQGVLVRDLDAARRIAAWHAEHHPGPLLLLPIAPGPSSSSSATTVSIAVDTPAEPWVASLLAGAELLDGIATAIRRPNGAVFLAASDAGGPLRRRAELDDLGVELAEGSQRRTELAAQLAGVEQEHATAERDLAGATEHAAQTKQAFREAQSHADAASRRALRSEREHGEAEALLARIRERLAERQERLQSAVSEAEGAGSERARLEETLDAERSALADVEAAQEAARERRVHWQVEEAQVLAREQAAREREDRARQELAATQDEQAALRTELEEIELRIEELTGRRGEWSDRLGELRTTIQELERAVEEAEAAVTAADAAVEHTDAQLAQGRTELDGMSERLHTTEVELTALDGRRAALAERLEAEWHKPLDQLLADAEPVEGEWDVLRTRATELAETIERLGPVNPLAMQEHAEEVERLEFLTAQREDLVAAKASLQQALREIEETARSMFVETFAAIRDNFHKVFHTLFEGGECDLKLSDPSDPLESPIDIHAAPRGKRTQRIHLLSSGERALVAISLLLSIYLTKPAPFCLLDEVDAPLDDANVMRFVRLLDEFKASTQFIVITHNPRTMQVADAVYGVTMQEPGVSTIVGVRLGEAAGTSV